MTVIVLTSIVPYQLPEIFESISALKGERGEPKFFGILYDILETTKCSYLQYKCAATLLPEACANGYKVCIICGKGYGGKKPRFQEADVSSACAAPANHDAQVPRCLRFFYTYLESPTVFLFIVF